MLPRVDVHRLAHTTPLQHCRKWHTEAVELMVRIDYTC